MVCLSLFITRWRLRICGPPGLGELRRPPYLKNETKSKKNRGLYEVPENKRWVTCREPDRNLRFATREKKVRMKIQIFHCTALGSHEVTNGLLYCLVECMKQGMRTMNIRQFSLRAGTGAPKKLLVGITCIF